MLFKEKLKQLPQRPGVYMMLDTLGNIIYVGKAKSLQNRVSQYFQNQKDRDPKVSEMIDNIYTFHYRVTDTELDALIEECHLIKELKPKYNRQMKNDRKYSYIKIPAEEYPKLTIVREKDEDGAIYFGPFTSMHQVETAVQCLNDLYPLRKCSTPRLGKSTHGCLYRQLGKCLGVCTGQVRSDEYRIHLDKIQQLINGKDTVAIQVLSGMLEKAIENLEFEKAAKYREYSLGLRHVIGKQRLAQSTRKNRNILAVEFIDSEFAKLFLIKGNKLLYGKVFNRLTSNDLVSNQCLERLIKDTFMTDKSEPHILTQRDIDEAQIIRRLIYWILSP
jgi:excinuclease ABC subunit C